MRTSLKALLVVLWLASEAIGAACAVATPTRRHLPHNDTLYSPGKIGDPVEGEECTGKAGPADFAQGGNPLVPTITIGKPTADGEQTSDLVSPNPGLECVHPLGDTTDGKVVAFAIGDAPEKCFTCTKGVTADARKVLDCIGKVVSKYFPFNNKDWALPCRDPHGNPLDESRTLAWYRLYTGVKAQTEDYIGSVSNTVAASEGRLEDGTVNVMGGGQEGEDFAVVADVPSMEAKDGTKVGELKNKA